LGLEKKKGGAGRAGVIDRDFTGLDREKALGELSGLKK